MATQRTRTSSGSKSRDTRGSKRSQDEIRDDLQREADKAKPDAVALGRQGTPGRNHHH